MSDMVLIDTNVLLDVIMERKPFLEFSKLALKKCIEEGMEICIAAHSFTDMWYIMRKGFSDEQRREILLNLLENNYVVALDYRKLYSAINRNDFSEFEDCLQEECAFESGADFIITRNVADYKNARMPVMTPDQFVKSQRM